MSLSFCAVFMHIALLAAGAVSDQKSASVEKSNTAVESQTASPKKESPKKEVAADEKDASNEEGEAAETYTAAHRITLKTGKPLVVMVGADWCGPCQAMRRTILPRVRKDGFFRKVAFAHVNVDRDKKLADELTGGGVVPQLVMYRKTKDGWMRRKLIGGHSVEEVEQFIDEGLAMDAEEHARDDENANKESSVRKTANYDPSEADEKRG
jgi:thiol-disulfide isomerase/thioredoxin